MNDVLTTLASFAPNYLATLALGAVCAYLGIFTILRRIVFTGAALAQAAAAGVAASFWLAALPGAPVVLLGRFGATIGSIGASVLAALALARSPRRGRSTPDAKVGVVFAAASALSVLFVWRSSSGLVELKNILAGDVLLSSSSDLTSLWFGVVGVALLHAFLRRRFLLVAYDAAFARAQGLNVVVLEQVFLASLAIAVALALRAAGLMLVFGTLVLPPLVGLIVAPTLFRATLVAIGSAWTASLVGFCVATHYNLPVAPSIVAAQLALLGLSPFAGRALEFLTLAGGAAALALGLALPAFAAERVERATPTIAGSPAPANGHQHADPRQRAFDERVAMLANLSLPEDVRVRAAADLERLGDLNAIRPLLEATGDPHLALVERARQAVVALAGRGTAAGTEELRALATGPDRELATLAARALAELDPAQALPLLVERLADPSVPLLLRDDIHTYLASRDPDSPTGYDAFALPEENAAALAAWRAWAKGDASDPPRQQN
ncbi:MAG: metal ABC transporter permease [Planctomycetota bacterium]